MLKICKKCGYERKEIESVSEHECPKCGAIYAKVEARLMNETEKLRRQKEQNEGKGKRCKRCGQVNQVDETICISCKSKNDLKGVEIENYLNSAFKLKKGSYQPVETVKKLPLIETVENSNSFGGILIILGILGVILAFNMNVTVETNGMTVNNIGLMDNRRNFLIISSLSILAGIIFFGFNSILNNQSSQSTDTRFCPYCAETVRVEAKLCKHCGKNIPKQNSKT